MNALDKHCEECGQDTTMRGFVNRIPGDQGGYICGPCVSEFYSTWKCQGCESEADLNDDGFCEDCSDPNPTPWVKVLEAIERIEANETPEEEVER